MEVRLIITPRSQACERTNRDQFTDCVLVENEARAVRILEIMNDFRTLQIHISSLITRNEANPPDQQSYYLDGYVVLRQSAAESQAILATHYNPGNLGLQQGHIAETEVQKAILQRCNFLNKEWGSY